MQQRHSVSPETEGWRYLGVEVVDLEPGEQLLVHQDQRESAIVVVEGAVTIAGAGLDAAVVRRDPFRSMSELVYLPPRERVAIVAQVSSQVSIGTAPAQGLHPPRIVHTHEMVSVLRGGGPARRQVTSPLAHPLLAESLVVYEAYVPRGAWSGWPPHRHDGEDGSPYLEETYYVRFDRPNGFGLHRNYTNDGAYDEHRLVRDGSLTPVPRGYHVCGASPAANMWVLNFLAGAPQDRHRPPCFDPAELWITDDWERDLMTLPAVTPPQP